MTFLIEHIDMYIMYIILGYVFLKTFQYVSVSEDKGSGIDSKLISSFIIGYIYYKICNAIPWHISNEVDTVGIFASAFGIAFGLGKLLSSEIAFKTLLIKLGIRQTPNRYIWNDLFGDYSMQVIVKYEKATYDGFIHLIEPYNNSPQIVLGSYIEYNSSGEVINDQRYSNEQLLILDLSKALSVEIKYFEEDEMCKLIKDLCDSREVMYTTLQE